MSDIQYAKLKDLVGEETQGELYTKPGAEFTILEFGDSKYTKYNTDTGKFENSEKWAKGFSKKHTVDTSAGRIDMSVPQLTNLLLALMENPDTKKALGELLAGQPFTAVKTCPKELMHTKYYFKAVKAQSHPQIAPDKEDDEFAPVDLTDVPF